MSGGRQVEAHPLYVLLARAMVEREQLGLGPKEGFKLSPAAQARRARRKAQYAKPKNPTSLHG